MALVMIHHSGTPIVRGGFIGVDVFFVLSGFLITALLVQEFSAQGRIRLGRFYMRRALRLAPALLALLAVYCLASLRLLNPDWARHNLIDAGITLCYATNWARAFDLHPPDFLGHTWSLSIEEQFYLLWPLLLIAGLRGIARRGWLTVAILLAAAAAAGVRAWMTLHEATLMRLYNGLDTRADALLVGASLGAALASGLMPRAESRRATRMVAALGLLGAGTLAWSVATMEVADPATYLWRSIVVELATALILIDLTQNSGSWLRPLLAWRPLVGLGVISYGLYLWHYPLFRLLMAFKLSPRAVLLLGSATALAAALASYHMVERPCLRRKNRWAAQAPAETTT